MITKPQDFEQRILVAVTGMSPQILTETLYALIVDASEPFQPTQIHLLSTAKGAKHAELTLIGEEPGWLDRFWRDFGLEPALDPKAVHIHALTRGDSQPLDDIRSDADNTAIANALTEKIRDLTHNPDSAVHLSIAGGRKTMGFYAGYALSLFGRPQDRMSHVLVSEPFESHRDFFYPTPYKRVIYDRDGKPLNTQDARITLADIPFVRMREGMPEHLKTGVATYSESVHAAQKSIGPLEVAIDLRKRQVICSGEAVSLPPAELAFYSWMAKRKLANLPPIPRPPDFFDKNYAREFMAEYEEIVKHSGGHVKVEDSLEHGMSVDYFDARKSLIKKKLRKALDVAATPYCITAFGKRRSYTYGISEKVRRIIFVNEQP